MAIISIENATFSLVFVTAILALVSWHNANLTKKAFQSSIILNLTESYASDEMNEAMKNVRQYWDGNPENFLHKIVESKILDNQRRKISHHFLKIYLLKVSDVIDDSLMMKLASKGSIEYLLEIIEPVEKYLNPKYNQDMFDEYRRILKLF